LKEREENSKKRIQKEYFRGKVWEGDKINNKNQPKKKNEKK